MPSPPTNRQPSREEIIAYIMEIAAQKGIDPNTLMQVLSGESGLNPAAVGDQGHSVGIAQLYDKGEAPEFTRRTGLDPADPSNWKQQVDFMTDRVTQGKGGWEPWHAAKNAGIAQYEGLPGNRGQAPGRRGRAGELAAMAQPPQVPQPAQPQKTSGLMDMFKEYQDRVDPRGPQTLGAWVGDRLGANDPNARQSERTHSLLGLLANKISPPSEQEQNARDLEGYNEFLPKGRAAQIEDLKKRKNLGSGVMGMFGFG